MKKRLTSFCAALALLLGLCACGETAEGPTWQEQFDLGVRYLSQGNYQEAILAFEAAIEIDPKQPAAYAELANVYLAMDDAAQAVAVLERGLAATGDAGLQARLDELIDAESESNGENIRWSYDESTQTLTIGGSGKMANYNYIDEGQYDSPWESYRTSVINVVIESGVTSIGDRAFADCYRLTSVTLPESLTSIRVAAFADCTSLTSITIPDSVTSIEYAAFTGCTSLTDISVGSQNPSYTDVDGVLFSKDMTLLHTYPAGKQANSYSVPSGVTSIGVYAFQICNNLTNVTIPDGVTSIGAYAFQSCTNLSSITIPDGVTSIELVTFGDCESLTNITLPGSVTSIGSTAFCGCSSLRSITMPSSVTSIGRLAFSSCADLISITIPDGVTSIEKLTFQYCHGLTSITIPSSVTSIGDRAFLWCDSLTDVYYTGTEQQWALIAIDDNDNGDNENGNAPLLNATIHYNSAG